MLCMVDSGSTSTFINKSVAKKMKLFIIPKLKSICLPDPNQKAQIVGEVVINLTLKNKTHSVIIEVIDQFFVDLIIGKDILRKYNKVTFNFKGSNDELIIGTDHRGH